MGLLHMINGKYKNEQTRAGQGTSNAHTAFQPGVMWQQIKQDCK